MSSEIQLIESGKEIINSNAISSLLLLSANLFAAKGMIPTSFKSKEEVFAALQLGYEIGLKPMVSLRSIMVFNGRPALFGDSMLALAQSTGQLEDIQEFYDENLKASVCIVKRSTRKSETKAIYTEEDANKNPNITNSTWKNHRKRMMQMRARAFALRDSFPDVLAGLYDEFEIKEIEKVTESKSSGDIQVDQAFEEPVTIEHEEPKEEVKELTPLEDATNKLAGLYYLGFDTGKHNEAITLAKKDGDFKSLFAIIDQILVSVPVDEFEFTLAKAEIMAKAKKLNHKPTIEEIKSANSAQELERIRKSLEV